MANATIDISIKSINEERRQIEGWATRVEEDRVGDIVIPTGAVYKLPLPLLLDHDHSKSVGHVDRVEVSKNGIRFWAHVKKIAEDGEAKNLTDYAWTLLKNGLRSAVSIGFRALDAERIPNSFGVTYKSWEWLELSAVTVPAHQGAVITAIKNVNNSFVTVPSNYQRGIPLVKAKFSDLHPGSVRLIKASS